MDVEKGSGLNPGYLQKPQIAEGLSSLFFSVALMCLRLREEVKGYYEGPLEGNHNLIALYEP